MTGYDGYIGSHLSIYLSNRGYTVIPYIGNILNFDISEEDIPDMVIHLAALTGVRKSIEMPDEYFKVNVLGTREVFLVCDILDIPLIFASSSNAKEVNNPYAETKLINEIDRIKNSLGVRPHTVFPGRDDMLYQSILRGDVKYINGAHYRDFTHIDDLCSAIFTLIDNYGIMVGKVIDIGTGISVSVLEVANAMGWNGDVKYDPTPNERVKTSADISELSSLGWKPERNTLDEHRIL